MKRLAATIRFLTIVPLPGGLVARLRRGIRLPGDRWHADGLGRGYVDLLGIRTRLVGKIDLSVRANPPEYLRIGCRTNEHQ